MKVALSGVLFLFSAIASAQDASVGKDLFQECVACHSIKSGENLVGPSLAGTYGKKAGAAEGFRYSGPLKKSGLTWDEGALDAYIANPQAAIPGTRMPYSGMSSAESRKNLIAYLRTL
ncbi:c-type cytochrome [Polynucleobacter sp.]|jgi:cytochrome c|uniref:c-type cytochrome n=1 Tax=Polynucleobacter sp. TaxID=2029855 RepID=UPI0037C9F7FB